jgi:putative nucleotidyltransferase with HDIG domain
MKKRASMARHTVRIPVEQLSKGMYVSQLDRPWLDTPFLFQGFPVHDQDDLFALKNICEFVYIDTLKSQVRPEQTSHHPMLKGSKIHYYPVRETVEKEVVFAHGAYRRSYTSVKTLLDAVTRNESFDATPFRSHVKECVQSIERNPSAMLWLTRIKHVDHYTAEHCLNVGVLAIALGRHLGVGKKHLELLGLCGMLHDVGKMKVDQSLINYPGKLTVNEFEQVKQHTRFGKEVLEEDASINREVITAAYAHHERMDGQGYPRGLDASNLNFYTKVVSIVDAYDAMTSRRCYSAGTTSAEALKILYENSGTQFDQRLVVKFIECIGIYPPGALVEVSSGEVGIVLSVEPGHRLLPKIALLLNADKKPLPEHYIVDLKQQRETDAPNPMHIKTVLMDGAHGINLEHFTKQNIKLD